MDREHVLAQLNNVRTASSLSPTYLFRSSGPQNSTETVQIIQESASLGTVYHPVKQSQHKEDWVEYLDIP